MTNLEDFLKKYLFTRNILIRKFLAELLGSFILAYCGIGGAHQATIFKSGPVGAALCGGLGLALGIYVAAKASGGHLNPAVTIANGLLGRFGCGVKKNLISIFVYILAQMIGMFAAAAVNYSFYNRLELEIENLTCLYATCPSHESSSFTALLMDQIFSTGILVFTIFATTDPKNVRPKGMAPLLIGLSATAIGLSFGAHSGGAINPARDLGPRFFSLLVFGREAFATNFFLIPLLGPILGAILASIIYCISISAHWPDTDDENLDSETLVVKLDKV